MLLRPVVDGAHGLLHGGVLRPEIREAREERRALQLLAPTVVVGAANFRPPGAERLARRREKVVNPDVASPGARLHPRDLLLGQRAQGMERGGEEEARLVVDGHPGPRLTNGVLTI